jgi:phospholipase/lecithinase/hemolysin
MSTGKQNASPKENTEQPAPVALPADVVALVQRLKAIGAEQILYTLGGLKVEADRNPGFDLGFAEWLVIRLPVGDRLADGRIWEV